MKKPGYETRVGFTLILISLFVFALWYVGAHEGAERGNIVADNFNKKDGYPTAKMAADVFPVFWLWLSFFVLMFITWFSWLRYGIVKLLGHKSTQEV